jgi:LmbE family N-acetylglucosaminyl deacetylase
MADRLTLMAVHAHPDDEALGTGGVLVRYAREGIRTVLVTCTNGEFGDMPGGIKPDQPGHDPEEVVRIRRGELDAAAKALGVAHLERLGYRDSGMMGWPQNDDDRSFWHTPIDVAADKLVEIFERYRPDVVVTYDDRGFYGHPDHIQTHRVTMRAVERTGIPIKVYETAIGFGDIRRMYERMQEMGVSIDAETQRDFDPEHPSIGVPDEQITTRVDVTDYLGTKRDAIAAHASQTENAWFVAMPEDMLKKFFSQEAFVRRIDRTGAPTPEDDLFAGLR